MYKFDHPNVLKLLGVCLDGGPAPYIIMPYMENGSLDTYLKKERENFLLDPETAQPDDVVGTYWLQISMHSLLIGPSKKTVNHSAA